MSVYFWHEDYGTAGVSISLPAGAVVVSEVEYRARVQQIKDASSAVLAITKARIDLSPTGSRFGASPLNGAHVSAPSVAFVAGLDVGVSSGSLKLDGEQWDGKTARAKAGVHVAEVEVTSGAARRTVRAEFEVGHQ